MANKQNYPKQPNNPNRTPDQSVTWVRNLEKIQNNPRIVVKLPPGAKNPIPQPKRQSK